MKRLAVAPRPIASRFKFIGETIAELRKVVWPTRRETMHLTVMVVIISLAVGAILGALDYGFTHMVDSLFLGG
jgi:preprotein translocase subunit SecE